MTRSWQTALKAKDTPERGSGAPAAARAASPAMPSPERSDSRPAGSAGVRACPHPGSQPQVRKQPERRPER